MASFEIRQSLRPAARNAAAIILLFGSLAASRMGLAQPAFAPVANSDRQQQIVDAIQQEESQNGSYSANLIAPWTALALLYDEDGSRALAVGAIEQARQVLRANYGLRTMQEVPLIWQEARIDKAGGDAKGAWDLEQELLRRISRHPDDVGAVPILSEMADERLEWLRRYRGGELPVEIVLGCYYDQTASPRTGLFDLGAEVGSGSCTAGSSTHVVLSLFREAERYYLQAIGVLDRNRRYSSEELQDLEARLIRASYSFKDYIAGQQSYRRLISYNAANSAPWLTRVETFLEAADWDLLFAQHQGTHVLDGIIEDYEQAYALLEHKSILQSSIDELFAPQIPVVLPSFLPNPLATKPSSGSGGYIDVAFDIGEYGDAAQVRILGSTADATSADRRELVRLIKRRLFRPVVKNGRVADGSRVVLRYYLSSPSKRAALP